MILSLHIFIDIVPTGITISLHTPPFHLVKSFLFISGFVIEISVTLVAC